MSYQMPNRNRWTFWVAAPWVMSIFVISMSILTALTRGINFSTEGVAVDIGVWGASVGVCFFAVQFAVLVSIANSTYQNSCDKLAE